MLWAKLKALVEEQSDQDIVHYLELILGYKKSGAVGYDVLLHSEYHITALPPTDQGAPEVG